jgi:hypothetical protein
MREHKQIATEENNKNNKIVEIDLEVTSIP